MAEQPLSALRLGETARLGSLSALDPDLARELAALRLLPGEILTVVTAVGRGGPVLVQGSGGIFALGRRLADSLMTESPA